MTVIRAEPPSLWTRDQTQLLKLQNHVYTVINIVTVTLALYTSLHKTDKNLLIFKYLGIFCIQQSTSSVTLFWSPATTAGQKTNAIKNFMPAN